MDGHVRPVSAYGPTKTAAERSLLKKLQDRTRTGHSNDLTAMHKIPHHALSLPPGSVVAVFIGEPPRRPRGVVQREVMIAPEAGGQVDAAFRGAVP